MAAMNFVVKYFAEIASKIKPVRRRFAAHLAAAMRQGGDDEQTSRCIPG